MMALSYRWLRRLSVLLALLPGSPLLAEVCTGVPTAVPVTSPQVSFLRSYPYRFASPLRLAVNAAGAVYVADPKRGEVVVRAADGRVIQHRRGLGRPGAIALDDANRIYLADLDSGIISVFDAEWQALYQFAAGELEQPGDIAIDNAAGRVYVSDSENHRVVVFSTSGERLFDFGTAGNGDAQLLYPSGVFFDALHNEVLVSDQLGYRIQAFSATGDWLYCFGGSSASSGSFFQRGRLLSAPQGLWADASGRIYIADSYDGQIKVVDRSGRPLGSIGSFGTTPGELRIPSDVVIDPFGRLFVASTNNARLEVFGIDGFSDPEQFAPALLTGYPATLRADAAGTLAIQFKVPGYPLHTIQTDSIRANQIPALSVESRDFDGDAIAELRAVFDQAALLKTLPNSGPGVIQLQGNLALLAFEGSAEVEVIAALTPDSDHDGIADDLDACPLTLDGAIVNTSGCAIQQLCRCEPNTLHGGYVSCVTKTSRQFVKAGLIEHKLRRQLIKQAGQSDCAKRARSRQEGHEQEHGERDDAGETSRRHKRGNTDGKDQHSDRGKKPQQLKSTREDRS